LNAPVYVSTYTANARKKTPTAARRSPLIARSSRNATESLRFHRTHGHHGSRGVC
jgi:hypothetical protein